MYLMIVTVTAGASSTPLALQPCRTIPSTVLDSDIRFEKTSRRTYVSFNLGTSLRRCVTSGRGVAFVLEEMNSVVERYTEQFSGVCDRLASGGVQFDRIPFLKGM
jgi:hypothetical protein